MRRFSRAGMAAQGYRRAGKMLTHRVIPREVWAADTDVRYLGGYIRSLRQTIERNLERQAYIPTETGTGYRPAVREQRLMTRFRLPGIRFARRRRLER